MKPRKLLFSVTIKDCDVQAFTVGGHGGAGKDTSNTGVRVVHRKSGATGRAVDTRSYDMNRRLAFVRMAESRQFRLWVRAEASRLMGQETPEEVVDKLMSRTEDFRVEVRGEDGEWHKV